MEIATREINKDIPPLINKSLPNFGPIDLEILLSKLIGPAILFISLISFSELSIKKII